MSIKHQQGFSLIEVLVTVIVLAFGLLGIAGLQAISLKQNSSALLRSYATYQTQDILDRMRVNRSAAITSPFNYNQAMAAGKPAGSSLANQDVNAWLTNIERELPNGDGSITCAATAICTITVQWDDSRGGAAVQQFLTSAEL